MAILNPSLHRRRSQPLPAIIDEQAQAPTTPGSSGKKPEGSPRQPFVTSGILIRKVSKIFSSRSKRLKEPKTQDSTKLRHAPVGHIAVGRPGHRYSSTTPSPSTESFDSDIRQPSGLGRLRTGSLSSNCDNDTQSTMPYERVRAASTPTLLRPEGLGVKTPPRRVSGGRNVPRIPQSVLQLIVSFLPRRCVTYVAVVSWAFCEAARATLYAHLDGRCIRPARFVKLISLLAVRHDLGLLTEALTIHIWPPSFYMEGETQVSMLAPSTPSFAKALLNMHRLKTLTLPSFEYTLMRYFSPLMLTNATFLNHTMSVGDQLQLRTWLECQEEIKHLAFPVLIERPNEGPSSPLSQTVSVRPIPEATLTPPSKPPVLPFLSSAPGGASTPPPSPRPRTSPHPSPLSSPLPSPRIPFPQTSSSTSSINSKSKPTLTPILPHLESLNATPNLTTSLLVQTPSPNKPPFPPLHKITLRIHKSLYSGLRPSTVMQAIARRGTEDLDLCFSEDIDPRTMEKVLTSVGALLGLNHPLADGKSSSVPPATPLLGLRITFEGSTPEEGIYRIMSSTLARFKTLRSVQVQRSTSYGQQPSPSTTTSIIRLATPCRNKPGNSNANATAAEPKALVALSDTEQTYLSSWLKCCPTLREICFTSGTRWATTES